MATTEFASVAETPILLVVAPALTVPVMTPLDERESPIALNDPEVTAHAKVPYPPVTAKV